MRRVTNYYMTFRASTLPEIEDPRKDLVYSGDYVTSFVCSVLSPSPYRISTLKNCLNLYGQQIFKPSLFCTSAYSDIDELV